MEARRRPWTDAQVEPTRTVTVGPLVVDITNRHRDKTQGSQLMRAVIDDLSHDVPTALTELRRLGRILKQRGSDILAYFDRTGTSNGPTEAINGSLGHLRGSAPGSATALWLGRWRRRRGGLGLTPAAARFLMQVNGRRSEYTGDHLGQEGGRLQVLRNPVLRQDDAR